MKPLKMDSPECHNANVVVVLGPRSLSGCVRGRVKINVFIGGYFQINNIALVSICLFTHSLSRLFRNSLIDK